MHVFVKDKIMLERIPVNLITGYLGVGKTTAIVNLLKQKPEDEKWAVLVNDFGEVSIDHLTLASEGNKDLQVLEVEGGCICCSAAQNMHFSLQMMLTRLRPNRILIEPTGMGHPASILDLLRSRAFSNDIYVDTTICILNPAQLSRERYQTDGTYLDQISLADVLVANKTDLCTEEELEFFWEYAEELYPPKLVVDRIEQGRLKPEWLSLGIDENRLPQFPNEHLEHESPVENHTTQSVLFQQVPRVGKPIMKPNKGLGSYSCGWIFSHKEVFDLNKLNMLIVRWYFDNKIHRAKGILRTGEDWYLYNCVEGMPTSHYLAYRRDSRLELISSEPLDWKALQVQIQECIV